MGANSARETDTVRRSTSSPDVYKETYDQAIKSGQNKDTAKQLADQARQIAANQVEAGIDTTKSQGDAYGQAAVGSQSVRRRGSTEQQRVGQDTRVREMGNTEGGMGSAEQAGMAAGMEAPTQQAQAPTGVNPMWKATRAPTDLASVQARVVQSLSGMKR